MRLLRTFEEFLQDGTVAKASPNMPRARSLAVEAGRRKRFLHEMLSKIGMSDDNANYFIESSYDIVISLLRAKMLAAGYISSGKGAHEAEVSFMRKLSFAEIDVRFMNDLRYYRNGILYYGERFDARYGKKAVDFMERMFPRLETKNQSGHFE